MEMMRKRTCENEREEKGKNKREIVSEHDGDERMIVVNIGKAVHRGTRQLGPI